MDQDGGVGVDERSQDGAGVAPDRRRMWVGAGAVGVVTAVVAVGLGFGLLGDTGPILGIGAAAGGVGSVAALMRWTDRPMPGVGFWQRPPGRVFHLTYVVALVMLLVSASVPGSMFVLMMVSCTLLSFASLVWVCRAVFYGIARTRGRAAGRAASLLVVPLVWLFAAGLGIAEAPLRVRWTLSRDAFEDVVADIAPAAGQGAVSGDWETVEVPSRVGLYRITAAYTVDDAVIFYERNGAFLNDAGFAYLPDGPSRELENGRFEMPAYRHLGGDWYAWTASW